MKNEYRVQKNVKVTVEKDTAIVQDDFGRKWVLNGTFQTETAMTMMLAQTMNAFYENEISVRDEFEITITIKRKDTKS